MKPMAWKVWYTNGRVFTSRGRDPIKAWAALPEEGVVSVVEFMDELANKYTRYTQVREGTDTYFIVLKDDEWCIWNSDAEDAEILRKYPEAKHFKRGSWVVDSEMDRIGEAALVEEWWEDKLLPIPEPCLDCD